MWGMIGLVLLLVCGQPVEVGKSISVPDWVRRVPEDCFVGISRPCTTIEEARREAFDSAISQILQALGANYRLEHQYTLSGNAAKASHELKEKLVYSSKWFMDSIQQRVLQSHIASHRGKVVYFVLIHLPPHGIERLRRLTLGPKAGARIVNQAGGRVEIKVTETNGVRVTFTDYTMDVTRKNRHAGIITLFLWKVPDMVSRHIEGVIGREFSLKGTSKSLEIPIRLPNNGLKSAFLGAQNRLEILLQGHDEIGRPVSVSVQPLQN